MTKEALIEVVKERLSGDGAEYNVGYVEYNIALAFNSLYYKSCLNGMIDNELHVTQYVNQIVIYDQLSDEYYIPLPYAPVQLPKNGQGVRRLSAMQGRTLKFVPSNEQASDILAGLEISKVPNIIGYIVYKDQIILDRNPGISKVKFNMIKGFQDIDYDEEIYVPAGQDEYLVRSILEFMSNTPDDKQVNDNNKKTP